jgi:hypothetical protein
MRAQLIGALVLFCAAGCGGGLLRLPDTALLGLPTEGRRWVYDAENAIVAALDGVDVAKEELREAVQQTERAQRSLQLSQQAQKDRGPLGVQAAQERLRLCQLQRDLAEQRLVVAKRKVGKARADLELDKARLVVTYDLLAVRGFSLQPYEAQAQDAARRVDSAQAQAEALAHKVQEQEERAHKAQQSYIAQSNDHDSGVWLD